MKNANLKKDERKKTEKEKKDTKKEDYVTLTQGQFDKILETIGELTIAAEQNEKGTRGEYFQSQLVSKSIAPLNIQFYH